MASDKRVQVTLECQECKRRNYNTTKSKVNTRERIELKKYCRWVVTTWTTRRRAESVFLSADPPRFFLRDV